MKDQNRKFSVCIFCGCQLTNQNRTKEHYYGKSIAQSVKRRTDWPIAHDRSAKDAPILFNTLNGVCNTCNTQKLKNDIDVPRDFILSLILREGEDVLCETKYLRRYFTRFMILFDVDSSDYKLRSTDARRANDGDYLKFRRHPPLTTSEERTRFAEGEDIERCKVFLGTHRSAFGATVNNWVYNPVLYSMSANRTDLQAPLFKMFVSILGGMAFTITLGNTPFDDAEVPGMPISISTSELSTIDLPEIQVRDLYALPYRLRGREVEERISNPLLNAHIPLALRLGLERV